MRKFIHLFIYLSIYSCEAQKVSVIDSENSDLIIFETKFRLTNFAYNTIYKRDNFILVKRIRARYNYERRYHETSFQFIKSKDTMNLNCICGQERNYFFKNLNFQKGNYELSFEFSKQYNEKSKKHEMLSNYVLGKEIKMLKDLQGILFKNAYVPSKKPVFQDVYFRDLEFYEIDLKDTINVKLKRME